MIKSLFKAVRLLLCAAAPGLCAAQGIERQLSLPENFGLRDAGARRAVVMTESTGSNPARLLHRASLEASCRALPPRTVPTFDADADQPDTVLVTRFMAPDGNAVADYSTHRALACTNPARPFDPCQCRYGFVTSRYITLKLRVGERLQTWRHRVGQAEVTRNTGAARSRAPVMLEPQIDAAQLGPVVGTAVVAGLRCELRVLREGHVCLYAAGDNVPPVLRNAVASAGAERDVGKHHFRVTDVAVRALVDAAVFEPPAGVAPEAPAPSRPAR